MGKIMAVNISEERGTQKKKCAFCQIDRRLGN